MSKKQHAERLVTYLRWPIILVLASASDTVPYLQLAAAMMIVAAYNVLAGWYIADSGRFLHRGRIAPVTWALDIAVITFIVGKTGTDGSLYYLLYWFVLVGFGFVSANLAELAVVTICVLVANAGATMYSLCASGNPGALAAAVGVRSAALVAGALIAVYIAKSRTHDELAAERGSYLHAILSCGSKLTSVRNVQELAHHVLETAVEETGADGGQLLLVSIETQELECEAFHPLHNAAPDEVTRQEALALSYAKWVVSTGKEFLSRIHGKVSGEVKTAEDDRPAIAVPLMWESSSNQGDGAALGVLVVVGRKGEEFREDALSMVRIFAAISSAAIVNLRLYTNMQRTFLRTLQTLAKGLEARDEYTRGHSDRVMQVACLIAEELNVPGESVEVLRNASLLHDIGKIGVPDAVLKKAGKLTSEEWETMRRHPIVSEDICRPLGLSPDVLFLVKHHHERLDSKGYPAGLAPHEQPLLQRILVVDDCFDAMRSRRPYRDAVPEEELRLELNRSAGRSMDPTVIETLMALMDRGALAPIYEEHDRMVGFTTAKAAPDLRKAA